MTTDPHAENGRKRRSDFEANRDVILRAADAAFSEEGADVSVGAIAKRAGVAPATIYRHFSNRHALGKAVYDMRVDAYTEVVNRAREITDPGASFRHTVHGIVKLQARDRSFRDLISTYEEETPDRDGDSKLSNFGRLMLTNFDRARDAGAIRADVTNADIALLLVACEGIARLASEHSMVPMRRVVDVMLDGVMYTSTKLDGAPLTEEEIFDLT